MEGTRAIAGLIVDEARYAMRLVTSLVCWEFPLAPSASAPVSAPGPIPIPIPSPVPVPVPIPLLHEPTASSVLQHLSTVGVSYGVGAALASACTDAPCDLDVACSAFMEAVRPITKDLVAASRESSYTTSARQSREMHLSIAAATRTFYPVRFDQTTLPDRVILTCNHVTTLDVPWLTQWAVAHGRAGDIRWVAGNAPGEYPNHPDLLSLGGLLGCVMEHGNETESIQKYCAALKKASKTYILVIFPEGGVIAAPRKVAAYRARCSKTNSASYKHLLHPRARGLEIILDVLDEAEWIDMTLRYVGANACEVTTNPVLRGLGASVKTTLNTLWHAKDAALSIPVAGSTTRHGDVQVASLVGLLLAGLCTVRHHQLIAARPDPQNLSSWEEGEGGKP